MRILVTLGLVLILSSFIAAKALFLNQPEPSRSVKQSPNTNYILENLASAREACYQIMRDFHFTIESNELPSESALHSDSLAELDSGRSEVSKLMLSLEDEIQAMDKQLESINSDLSSVQEKLVVAQSNMDHAVDEAGIEASKADQATLDKYASGVVDVSITEVKDNVPYQKDIYTHAKELAREAEVASNTEVISL